MILHFLHVSDVLCTLCQLMIINDSTLLSCVTCLIFTFPSPCPWSPCLSCRRWTVWQEPPARAPQDLPLCVVVWDREDCLVCWPHHYPHPLGAPLLSHQAARSRIKQYTVCVSIKYDMKINVVYHCLTNIHYNHFNKLLDAFIFLTGIA